MSNGGEYGGKDGLVSRRFDSNNQKLLVQIPNVLSLPEGLPEPSLMSPPPSLLLNVIHLNKSLQKKTSAIVKNTI